MRKRMYLPTFLLLVYSHQTLAQETNWGKNQTKTDSLKKYNLTQTVSKSRAARPSRPSATAIIIPSTLIAYGILAHNNKRIKAIDQHTHLEVKKHFSKKIPYDDYIQFLPITSAYAMKLSGVKSKSSLADLTIVAATSHLMMASSVQLIKHTSLRWRPDGSSRNSFPSGHTATAFVGSHILLHEYYQTSPLIAFGGYTISTATGILRVLNKRHWVSDIVAGAGFGILSVELSYLLLPIIKKLLYPSLKNKKIAFTPIYNNKNSGLGFLYCY